MDEQKYVQDRLNDQIEWYDAKSIKNQRSFKFLQIVVIVVSATIPFLAGFSHISKFLVIAIGVAGVVVTVSTGLLALFRFQENWIQYRTTCESLKHEKYLYDARTGPYDREDAFAVLVQRVENLISKENSSWTSSMQEILSKVGHPNPVGDTKP